MQHWRGYLARQYAKRTRQDEFIWLGMASSFMSLGYDKKLKKKWHLYLILGANEFALQ